MYLVEDIAPIVETDTRKFVIISWIHSHVRGVKVGFSSIDMHTQHAYQKMSANTFGIVYEIRGNGNYVKDAFMLSTVGQETVEHCSRTRSVSSAQHSECYSETFYSSVLKRIRFTTDPIIVVDGTRNNGGMVARLGSWHVDEGQTGAKGRDYAVVEL